MEKSTLFAICLASLLSFPTQAQISNSEYKLTNKFHLEGDGGWDLLTSDDATNRLFVSHSSQVQVMDEKTGKQIGAIDSMNGVHGIAIADNLNKGFISSGKDSTVVVFDVTSYKVLDRVKVHGSSPDVITYRKSLNKVFVFNNRSSNFSIIDAKTNKETSTISLDGRPEVAVFDGDSIMYVDLEDKSTVDVVNLKTLKVEKNWPVTPGEEPSGMAFNNQTHRLFIGCGNKMLVVMNTQDGKVVTTLPIGEHVDGVVFDPIYKRAYSSNGDGTLTMIQEEKNDSFKVVENIVTQKGARTIALNEITHRLYLPTAEFGSTPAPTADNPHPRPSIKPNTFVILEVEKVK